MSEAGYESATDKVELLVLYDGVCGLCNGAVRFLLKADRKEKLRFAPLQGETAGNIRQRHGEVSDALDSIVLVKGLNTPSETILLASEAVLDICRELGGGWQLLSVFRIFPGRIRDVLYDFIANHRYQWFGKYDACPVPEPQVRDRFFP